MGSGVARATLRAAEVASVVVRRVPAPFDLRLFSGCEWSAPDTRNAPTPVSLPIMRAVSIGNTRDLGKVLPTCHRRLYRGTVPGRSDLDLFHRSHRAAFRGAARR